MSLLFTQNWNIKRGLEDEYEEFVSQSYIPRCNELGLVSVGGFYVQAGQGPQIISIKRVDSLQALFGVLAGDEFKQIKKELKEMVSHYTSRVLVQKRNVGPETYSIQEGVWKFNQYFDLRPGMEDAYNAFMQEAFIPAVEALDYVEFTREWDILIGGFSEILLELTFQDPIDIGRMMSSEIFREFAYKLSHDYGENFQNRVLRSTERFDKARWFRL